MNDDVEVPEPLNEALSDYAHALRLLGEPLRPQMLTDAYVAGLVAARAGAEHVTVKEWRAGSKYPVHRKLPFVLTFPCPFEHRSVDRKDIPRVSIIIEENGWFSMDPDSPCPECNADGIRDWLLTCPRCEAGEDSDRHNPMHWALDVFDIDGNYDASPLAWVMREFGRLAQASLARWWLEHTEEALDADPRAARSEATRERTRSSQIEWAQEVIDSAPKKKAKAAAAGESVMTVEEGALWLGRGGPMPRPRKMRMAAGPRLNGQAAPCPETPTLPTASIRRAARPTSATTSQTRRCMPCPASPTATSSAPALVSPRTPRVRSLTG